MIPWTVHLIPCVLAEFPPVHPIFVNFTAGLVPTSFLFEFLAIFSKKPIFRGVAWWSLLLAGLLTPLTVLFGWLWMESMPDNSMKWQMPFHQWLGTFFGAALLVLVVWRGVLYRRAVRPSVAYFAVAGCLFAALLCQGDLGGSMSFHRGLVFWSPPGHHQNSPTTAQTAPQAQAAVPQTHEAAPPRSQPSPP